MNIDMLVEKFAQNGEVTFETNVFSDAHIAYIKIVSMLCNKQHSEIDILHFEPAGINNYPTPVGETHCLNYKYKITYGPTVRLEIANIVGTNEYDITIWTE